MVVTEYRLGPAATNADYSISSGDTPDFEVVRDTTRSFVEAYQDSMRVLYATSHYDPNQTQQLKLTHMWTVGGHGEGVASFLTLALIYSPSLRKQLLVAGISVKDLLVGAFLHDCGKLETGLPFATWKKKKLTPEEKALIYEHPRLGRKILDAYQKMSGFEVSPVVYGAVTQHHERYDGSGPQQLRGDAISLSGQLVGLVDSIMARAENRAYFSDRHSLSEAFSIVTSDPSKYNPSFVAAIQPFIEHISQRLTLASESGIPESLQTGTQWVMRLPFT